jgi:hypothetical protein
MFLVTYRDGRTDTFQGNTYQIDGSLLEFYCGTGDIVASTRDWRTVRAIDDAEDGTGEPTEVQNEPVRLKVVNG